jgi:hypothetical protein
MPKRFPVFMATLVLFGTLLSLFLVSPGGAQLAMSPGMVKAKPPPETSGPHLTQGWPWDLFGSGRSERDRPWSAPPRDAVERSPQRTDKVERRKHRARHSGTYRTWCVRLCDGYYWPVSYSTTRDRFSRDAQKCELGCPLKSQLFVHRTSDDVDDMTDLEGDAYRDLKNAFRYRREYVADCTCRGHPWDAEAVARYRAYYVEATKRPKDKGPAKGKSAVATFKEKAAR